MSTVFRQLGPYEIIQPIGRGGMAQVFLATDTRTGNKVALKVVPAGQDAESREILAAEESGAELQRQFSRISPHVPAVYDCRHEAGFFLVAMEYLDGENLSEVIARGPLQPERAVHIALELCACLELAHRFEPVEGDRPMRLVHGDLKPLNVRITSTGAVKVLDFGSAKALSLSRKVTRNDFGTQPYLSPERLDGAGDVNEFADLWPVGVMLYEMVRGARPFDAPDTQRLERLIRSRRPPLPLTGRCPIGLEAIIARLLGPTPAVRYENARAIREDLQRFRSGRRTVAEELGWPSRPPDDEATRRSSPVVESDEEKTRRTRIVPPPLPPHVVAAATPRAPKAAQPAAAAAAPAPVAGRPRRRREGRVFFSFFGAAILIVGAMFMNELFVAGDARRLASDVSTRELAQLDEVWRAQETLAERSHLRFGTLRLESALRQRTLALSDKVITNYRLALTTVREGQWRSARDALRRAVRMAPGDRELLAALRYCEGHLHRIDGEADRQRNRQEEADRELAEAVSSFREAADLRTDWPDPFLGLARTFIYGLEDIDRGADALNQAQRRGYAPSDRDTGQLADGYRARGDTLARNAAGLSGMPQESDYLTRALEAYRRAITLYAQAGSLASGPANIRRTQRAYDRVQRRLDEMAPPAPLPDVPTEIPPPEPQPDPASQGGQTEEASPWV